MIALRRQSIRSSIRTVTLLAALTSLLLTMLTPFVGTAYGAHDDPYNATNGSLDDPTFDMIADACGGNADSQAKGGTKLDTIHADSPPVLTDSSVTPKDNLCDFWIDSTIDAHGEVWLYAAFTREATEGTAHVALELLNSAADCDITDYANCNPWENRTDGTRIIGFTWQCNDGLVSPTLWTYNGGFSTGQSLGTAFTGSTNDTGAFGEIAVNLTAAGILGNVNDPTAPCQLIAAIIPITLPGFSLGSQPKDVVLGDVDPIETCGSLKIVKSVDGGDDFGQTFVGVATSPTLPEALETDPLGHDGSHTFSGLKAHTFTITELIGTTELEIGDSTDGWTLRNIDCGDGSSTEPDDQVTIVAGQTATCTLYNAPDLPTLTLEKTVVNNWGGTATEDDFTPKVDSTTVSWDTAVDITPGSQPVASETWTITGYDDGDWGGDCDANGTLSDEAQLGQDYTCTITNSDTPGALRLVKVVSDEDDLYPDVDRDDFDPLVDEEDTIPAHVVDSETLQAEQDVEWYVDDDPDNTLIVPAGTYAPDEDDTTGPLADGRFFQQSIVCDDETGGETATVGVGETVTCTITNVAVGAGLTLIKDVTNAWGGSLGAGDFTLNVNGTPVTQGDTSGNFPAGTYDISEDAEDGYDLVRVVCTEGVDDDLETILDVTDPEELEDLLIEDLQVNAGDKVVCTFYNEDRPGELTVVKDVINDDGGTATSDDFSSNVDYTAFTDGEVAAGNEPATSPDWEDTQTVPQGDYTIGEDTPQDGYTLTGVACYTAEDVDEATWAPKDGATPIATDTTAAAVAINYDEHVVCIVTNDDEPGTLILEKDVTNNWDGQLEAGDFTLEYTPDGGTTETTSHGDENTVDAGTYTIGEQPENGYELVDIVCDDDAETELAAGEDTVDVTVGNGETVTCILSNRDLPASLTVLKKVVNDDGGTLDEDSFTPTVNDDDTDWGSQDTTIGDQTGVAAGSYTIDEHDPTSLGYALTDISCYASEDVTGTSPDPSVADGAQALDTAGTVDLDHEDDVTCIVTNDDEPGELTLVKEFENAEGGPATEDDFVPTIDGDDADWGVNTVSADTYTIDEIDALGSSYLEDGEYVQVSVFCDGQQTNSVTVVNGGDHECVITNRPVPAGLTIVKQVLNNWGGEAEPDDFGLTIDGEPQDSGVEVEGLPPGEYTFSEQVVAGYEQVDLFCASSRERDDLDDLALDTEVTLEVRNNEHLVCTFVNRDLPASVTVLKDVVNDDGGTATEDDFTPLVNDEESEWGAQGTTLESEYGDQFGVPVGSYTIGELLAAGYEMTDITCTDETVLGDEAETVTVEVGLDDAVTCTIVNDDIAPTVVLRKIVVNDDGGTLTQDDFPVTFDGDEAAWDETITTVAGDHVAAEETQQGYLAGDWGGDCAADGSLTTDIGGTYECTITNDDVPAGLTVVKEVVNDDGGSAVASDFPLTVTPEGGETVTVTSGIETIVGAGTYTVSEEQQPGYALTGIACDNGVATTEGSIEVTVGLDEAVICTLTNDDLPIGIQVIKVPDVEEITFVPGGEDEIVTYTYTVTNTGETTLTDLSLFDDVLGDIELPVDELVPGQTVFATAEHVVTQADADAGEIVNVAVAEGTSPDGRTTDDDDDAEVLVDEVEVLPNVVEKPAPAPAPAPVLPRTGFDTLQWALMAALVAGMGALLLLSTGEAQYARRRRD